MVLSWILIFSAKPCDALGEFDCNGDGSLCVPNEKVCDGRNDCLHREDEDAKMCKGMYLVY